MNIVKRNLCDLKRPERNIRLHPEKQMQEYIRSVKKNGQLKLIVIDEDNVIWIGNGLYEAMLACGYTEAYCLVKDGLTAADKKKMMMTDNRVYDLGVDDLDALDSFLQELKDDLDIPGYGEDLLRTMVMEADEAADALSEYGTIEPERVETIKETREKYEAQNDAAAQKAEEIMPVATSDTHTAEEPARRFILCPKCGERIWL